MVSKCFSMPMDKKARRFCDYVIALFSFATSQEHPFNTYLKSYVAIPIC